MPVLEKITEDAVVLYAEAHNWLHIKQNGLGSKGKPDNYFLSPRGVALFIEFKRQGEQLRPLQWYWAKQIAKRRALVYRCDNTAHGRQIIDNHMVPSRVPIEGVIAYDAAGECWTILGPGDGKNIHMLDGLPTITRPENGPQNAGDSSP